MELIKQRNPFGCLHSCAAMILHRYKHYTSSLAMLEAEFDYNNPLSPLEVSSFLLKYRIACVFLSQDCEIEKYGIQFIKKVDIRQHVKEHIGIFLLASNHAVVWDNKNKLMYDPALNEPYENKNPLKLLNVDGFIACVHF